MSILKHFNRRTKTERSLFLFLNSLCLFFPTAICFRTMRFQEKVIWFHLAHTKHQKLNQKNAERRNETSRHISGFQPDTCLIRNPSKYFETTSGFSLDTSLHYRLLWHYTSLSFGGNRKDYCDSLPPSPSLLFYLGSISLQCWNQRRAWSNFRI